MSSRMAHIFSLKNNPVGNPYADKEPTNGDFWLSPDKPLMFSDGEWVETEDKYVWHLFELTNAKSLN